MGPFTWEQKNTSGYKPPVARCKPTSAGWQYWTGLNVALSWLFNLKTYFDQHCRGSYPSIHKPTQNPLRICISPGLIRNFTVLNFYVAPTVNNLLIFLFIEPFNALAQIKTCLRSQTAFRVNSNYGIESVVYSPCSSSHILRQRKTCLLFSRT